MLAVVDQRLPMDSQEELMLLGYSVVKLPPHPSLPTPVASHPDMLIFFSSNAIFCTKSYQSIAQTELEQISDICGRPIQIITEEYGDTYPHDILLNAAPVGQRRLGLAGWVASELENDSAVRFCNVKQGYAKCSVIPIGEKALITDDPSIASVAQAEGLDVLQVSKNAVYLKGYDTGFIGGAASFAPYGNCNRILFCGNLDLHPDADAIRAFCNRYDTQAISLSSTPLTDVGTIFLI